MDLVNTFGKLGGFALLLERFTGAGAASLSVPVIAALLRPFGLCYEVLTPHVVETYFMPVVVSASSSHWTLCSLSCPDHLLLSTCRHFFLLA